MELKGKKISFLGDSITEGAVASKIENCYWMKFGELTGATVCGFGVGGTRIAPQCANFDEYDKNVFSVRAEKIPLDSDVIVVFGGTNDFGHGDAPFGEVGDTDKKTFCGALYSLLQDLIVKHPKAQIVLMTPLHRLSEEVNEKGVIRYPLKDFVKAEKEIAAMLSVPVLDLWSLSGMQPKIPVIKEMYMPDGLHPNDLGHRRIAERLIGFLKAL